GHLHAYLRGTGVEIQANSDNILRGGLTPKHVDVPELLSVVDFAHGDLPVLRGEQVAPNLLVYPTSTPEFELSRLDWPAGEPAPGPLRHAGPQVLICTDGAVCLTTPAGCVVTLGRGDSAWVPARDCADGPVLIRPDAPGRTQVFRATAGMA